jgi:hypothetical protein
VFRWVHPWSLSWATWIQPITSHAISVRLLRLQVVSSPQGFLLKPVGISHLSNSCYTLRSPHGSRVDRCSNIVWRDVQIVELFLLDLLGKSSVSMLNQKPTFWRSHPSPSSGLMWWMAICHWYIYQPVRTMPRPIGVMWLLTAESRVPSQVTLYEIRGRRADTSAGLSPS